MILSTARAEARHPQEHLAASHVDVHRKAVAVLERPGELGVDIEVEHLVYGSGRDLVHGEAVTAQELVGLIKPVLALQGR